MDGVVENTMAPQFRNAGDDSEVWNIKSAVSIYGYDDNCY